MIHSRHMIHSRRWPLRACVAVAGGASVALWVGAVLLARYSLQVLASLSAGLRL